MKLIKVSFVSLLIWLLFISNNAFTQDYNFWGSLEKGKYDAGFSVIYETDYSRNFYPETDITKKLYKESKGRPVKIYIWYPAEKSHNKNRVNFENYAEHMIEDYRIGIKTGKKPDINDFLKLNLFRAVEEERVPGLLKSKTGAYENISPPKDKFPILIFGQGFMYESPVSHFVLCEYLASHGYVVISCPLVGTYSGKVNLDMFDFETQIRDMEFLAGYGSALPYADKEKIGLIGFDLGGMSALILQKKNTNIDAFVSLDNGIIMEHNLTLIRQHPYYEDNMLRVPIIHFTKNTDDLEKIGIVENLTIFEKSEYSDIYFLRFKGLPHVTATSYAMFGIEKAVPMYWGNITPDSDKYYEIICKYSLQFLNAYLKSDGKALTYINEDTKKHIPSELNANIWSKKGKEEFPSEGEFMNVIFEKGINEAVELFRNIRKKRPEHVLFSEAGMNFFGYILLYRNGEVNKAIEIFKLITEAYPKSANAYDSLAEAYMQIGEVKNAIKNYEKSLELNPENTNAIEILKRLKNLK